MVGKGGVAADWHFVQACRGPVSHASREAGRAAGRSVLERMDWSRRRRHLVPPLLRDCCDSRLERTSGAKKVVGGLGDWWVVCSGCPIHRDGKLQMSLLDLLLTKSRRGGV